MVATRMSDNLYQFKPAGTQKVVFSDFEKSQMLHKRLGRYGIRNLKLL